MACEIMRPASSSGATRPLQIPRETLHEGRLHLRRHFAADLLLREINGQLGGITLQLQPRCLSGRYHLAGGMLAKTRQVRHRLFANTLRLRRLLAVRRGPQGFDFRLEARQPAVYVSRLRFGFRTNLLGLGNPSPDGYRLRYKPGPTVLLNQITQTSGENEEVGPGPNRRNTFRFSLAFGRRFVVAQLGFLWRLRRHRFPPNQQQATSQRAPGQPPHAALRLRRELAIWVANASLSPARLCFSCPTSCSKSALAWPI